MADLAQVVPSLGTLCGGGVFTDSSAALAAAAGPLQFTALDIKGTSADFWFPERL